jgi:type IV pilus assembly protein PilM
MRNQKTASSEVILILNLGPSDVDMMVIKNNFVRFSRNITLGGFSFNKAISQSLNVSDEQAEEYKKSYGLDVGQLDGKVRQALEPVVETLVSEITRTMNFYSTRNTASVFKKIIFSGVSSVMPGLLAYSAEKLGIEAELANPFPDIEFSPRLKSQRENIINLGPAYSIAVGLALKEFV